ncbi:MAG: hypothetical protein IPP81_04440 [Chitinophagaceae bacterium]|nr:hypothetical protein [Chitinophagaceae bacterium]
MEMTIFNHILFDSLMPWLVKSYDVTMMNEKLKEAAKVKNESMPGLVNQIKCLLNDKPRLLKWVESQPSNETESLRELTFSTELPEFTDTASKFYSLLIDQESFRIYNAYLSISEKYAHDEDLLHFHTVNALRNLKHYILTASKEIKRGNYQSIKNQPPIWLRLYCIMSSTNSLHFTSASSLSISMS